MFHYAFGCFVPFWRLLQRPRAIGGTVPGTVLLVALPPVTAAADAGDRPRLLGIPQQGRVGLSGHPDGLLRVDRGGRPGDGRQVKTSQPGPSVVPTTDPDVLDR